MCDALSGKKMIMLYNGDCTSTVNYPIEFVRNNMYVGIIFNGDDYMYTGILYIKYTREK